MYRAACAFSLILLLLTPLAGFADETRLPDAAALQAAMQKAIERAEPSIACILVCRGEDRRGFAPERPDFVPEVYGSGVVIDEKGLVLTNEHVIRGANRTGLYVRLPGEKGSYATVYAADQRSDLAVLKLDTELVGLKALPFGQGEKLRKGQFVLSLANPFAAGFRDGSPSASWGIISNLRRRAPLIEMKDEWQTVKPLSQSAMLIQTDARLNLGCSGGALIDLDGKLVGLTTALAALNGSETPGGFAVPLDAGFRHIIDKLRQGEEVEYGFLGVRFPTRPVQRGEGVPIEEVIPGGPAANGRPPLPVKAPILILSINGQRVRDREELSFHISTALAGDTVKVEWRPVGGKSTVSTVKLAKLYIPPERFSFVATKKSREVAGLRVEYSTVTLNRLSNTVPPGVVIREVQPNSAADRAQLTADRIITHVNGHAVSSPTDFYKAVDASNGKVELTIQGRPDKVSLDPR